MGDMCININIQNTFADTSICFCYTCRLPSHHIKESTKEAAEGRLLYMVAGEVASVAKTYRLISKYALNMYIDAYISHIPLEALSSQSSHTHLQACTKGVYSDYSMKITLDGVLLSQPCLERVVSWWPMMCPAYKNELPKIYPNCQKKQDDLFLAACHFHKCLKALFPKYYLRDSLAQLCWMERNIS